MLDEDVFNMAEDSPDSREHMVVRPKDAPDRRAFLVGAASLAAQVLLVPHASLGRERKAPGNPTRVPGDPSRAYGTRSSFVQSIRLAQTNRSKTPLQDLHGIITPSALHFERHHNGVPLIDPARHRMLVHGLVERPKIFTLEELKRFPSTTRTAFIECSGNSKNGWKGAGDTTAQETHGLTSTSEWCGVRLATILQECGVLSSATWILAEGSDAAVMTRSLPVERIIGEALLCYAQNGEPLRPEQGYPLRLFIPGWEGNTCIKWVRRLKLMPFPAMTREETSKYTDLMPDGTARQFTFEMEAKSVITFPSGGQRLREPGFHEIRGLAWSGRGRIAGVEVSVDGGKTWQEAALQGPVLSKCHTRFCLGWQWDGQETVIQSRCTDETGYRQPTQEELIAVRGTNSFYHNNAIQAWVIDKEGNVHHVPL